MYRTLDYSKVDWAELAPGLRYRPLLLDQFGAGRIDIAKGTRTEPHQHTDEQITYVVSGRVTFRVWDAAKVVHTETLLPGMMFGIGSNVLHELSADEDSTLVECWSSAERHRSNG